MTLYAESTTIATGGQTVLTIAFEYVEAGEVKCTINETAETDFTVSGSTLTMGGTVTIAANDRVRIYRETPIPDASVYSDFTNLTYFDGTAFDRHQKQLLHLVQEVLDKFGKQHTGEIRFDTVTLQNTTAADWSEQSGSKLAPQSLNQTNLNGNYPVVVDGNDIVFPAGTYEFTVAIGFANAGGTAADAQFRLTDDVDGPSQVSHFLSPAFEMLGSLSPSSVAANHVTFTKTLTFAHGDKLALRGRNNAASGNVLTIVPSQFTFRRIPS